MNQNFRQVLSLHGKYDSFLMGSHCISQERQVGVVSKEHREYILTSDLPLESRMKEEQQSMQYHLHFPKIKSMFR